MHCRPCNLNTGISKKCELAGVDAVVAEGFEAGGHNGRDENNHDGSDPSGRSSG